MSETVVSSGVVSSGLTLTTGEYLAVQSGGSAVSITISSVYGYTEAWVYAGGTAIGTALQANAALSDSGLTIGTTVADSSTEFVASAGVASGTVVSSGGELDVARGGEVVSTIVSSGGFSIMDVFSEVCSTSFPSASLSATTGTMAGGRAAQCPLYTRFC